MPWPSGHFCILTPYKFTSLTKGARNVSLLVLAVVLLVVGSIFLFTYFVRSFFSAFRPAEITVTKTAITSNRGFINPITIEKLKVDSFSEEQLPVKYVIEYLTTCSIKRVEGKPPVGLKKIRLTQPGRYSWSQEKVNIPITHVDRYRKRNDSGGGMIWSTSTERSAICPINFQKGNWYFIDFLDPGIVGIYIYIDSNDRVRQHTVYSGVSPI
jgi:hypothetical protein